MSVFQVQTPSYSLQYVHCLTINRLLLLQESKLFFLLDIYAQKFSLMEHVGFYFSITYFFFPKDYLLQVSCYTDNDIPK